MSQGNILSDELKLTTNKFGTHWEEWKFEIKCTYVGLLSPFNGHKLLHLWAKPWLDHMCICDSLPGFGNH